MNDILCVHIRKKLGTFQLEADFETSGGTFALFGPSGCGKSLTLKCIAGIERPDEGIITLGSKVLFDSQNKINLPPQKRHVGYMFQDYALFPNMTVRKNVLAGMGKKPALSDADPYLERFVLSDLSERYPQELSGGQKQRAALARIIAQKPDVILLDEPFSALDSDLKYQLEQEMIDVLKQENKPAVFVSHDREEVYLLSKQICLMKDGKAKDVVETEVYFSDPHNIPPYVFPHPNHTDFTISANQKNR